MAFGGINWLDFKKGTNIEDMRDHFFHVITFGWIRRNDGIQRLIHSPGIIRHFCDRCLLFIIGRKIAE